MKMNFSAKTIAFIVLSVFLLMYFVGVYWSFIPDDIDIKKEVTEAATSENVAPVVGYTTTTALIKVAESILDKPGG